MRSESVLDDRGVVVVKRIDDCIVDVRIERDMMHFVVGVEGFEVGVDVDAVAAGVIYGCLERVVALVDEMIVEAWYQLEELRSV